MDANWLRFESCLFGLDVKDKIFLEFDGVESTRRSQESGSFLRIGVGLEDRAGEGNNTFLIVVACILNALPISKHSYPYRCCSQYILDTRARARTQSSIDSG